MFKKLKIGIMKKIRYFLTFLAGVLTLGAVSCTEGLRPENMSGGSELTLTARLKEPATKVTDAGWSGNEIIGVKGDDGVKTYSVDVAGNMSTAAEPFRWKGREYEMTAWCPYIEGDAGIDLVNQSSKTEFFAKDLLRSTAAVTSTRQVDFLFEHQMTRMQWSLKAEGYQQADVDGAIVVFFGYGAVSYKDGEMACDPADADKEITTFNSVDSEGNRYGQAMMVPCEMWNKPLIKVVIGGDTYVYTPREDNESDKQDETGVLTAGYHQKYVLTISKRTLNVRMESEAIGWTEAPEMDVTDARLRVDCSTVSNLFEFKITGTDEGLIDDNTAGFTVSYTENGTGGLLWKGTCTIERSEENGTHTYRFTDIKSDITLSYLESVQTGYYYYDNGTWGPDQEMDGCTAVGRVFYVGKHQNDKSQYVMEKIRGYVVSTEYEDPTQRSWVTNPGNAEYLGSLESEEYNEISSVQETREGDYSGYLWTTSIDKAFSGFEFTWENDAPLWYAFKNIGIGAPAGSSGWYIPTVEQMKDIHNTGCIESLIDSYWSSQLYAGTGDTGPSHGIQDGDKTTIWAMRYYVGGKEIQYGWSGDPAKLLIVLTF